MTDVKHYFEAARTGTLPQDFNQWGYQMIMLLQ